MSRVVYTSPPMDRMTDACENITFPQLLLRTVINVLIIFRNWKIEFKQIYFFIDLR